LLYHHTTTILRQFFRDHPGEPVPEENFWTLWCKERLTEADTLTIRLGTTPSGLTSAHLHHPPIFFYGPDALPAAQPTVSKHWRQTIAQLASKFLNSVNSLTPLYTMCSDNKDVFFYHKQVVKVVWHKAASSPHEWYSPYFTTGYPSPSKLPLPKAESGAHLTHGSLGPPKPTSSQPKWHLDWFNHLCRAHDHDRLTDKTDRPTDYATRSTIISCIYVVLQCGLKIHTIRK